MDWFLYDNVMKGLKEMKQVALASEASKTFLDFITQHQVLVVFILMKWKFIYLQCTTQMLQFRVKQVKR